VDTFAFIIHPIDPKRDASRKFPFWASLFNARQINFLSTFFPPLLISKIEGVASNATGKQIRGWLIACPLTAERMLELPQKVAYYKIIQTGRLAERLGAQILGLGAFTSVIGDGGITVANGLDVPVTTGDAYTISIAVQAIRDAGHVLGIDIRESTLAIVGATGAIGQVCAEILAKNAAKIYLIGRNAEKLDQLRSRLTNIGAAEILTSVDIRDVAHAQLVITVSSDIHTIIPPEHLRPGSVVCDVARPRDVSKKVALDRKDVLVIDGGMVEVPGSVDFHFNFGFPPGKAYACMAETMILALEGKFVDYTVGKNISLQRVDEITSLAKKHGFRLSGFRSFEQPVSQEKIDYVRKHI